MTGKLKSDKNEFDEYIEDLKEWQDNQYNPGHYTGGNLNRELTVGGRASKIVGKTYIAGFLITLPIIVIAAKEFVSRMNNGLTSEEWFGALAFTIFFVIPDFLLFTVGVRKLSNKNKKSRKREED